MSMGTGPLWRGSVADFGVRGGGGARGSTGSKSNPHASQRWRVRAVSQSKSYISRLGYRTIAQNTVDKLL